jgi:hypothetical protein
MAGPRAGRRALLRLGVATAAGAAFAATFAPEARRAYALLRLEGGPRLEPYVDPRQLQLPWPQHSFLRQPWRGYLETIPALDLVTGPRRVGIHYNLPSGPHVDDAAVCRTLAAHGWRTVRLEIGWGNVDWEETGIGGVSAARLAAFREAGLRPLILLNAHQGAPCPHLGWTATVAEPARRGEREVRLASVRGIVPGYTGLSNLQGYWMAQVLITDVAPGGRCVLARPLPVDLPAGKAVQVDRLKYRPLAQVGSADFRETVAGWLRYVDLVCGLLRSAGFAAWDLEIWNELTFGSAFLYINNYYDPPLYEAHFGIPGLLPGQPAYELARATVAHVARAYPEAECIWGFSNTTFFHTPVPELPAGTSGQSYHPYGVVTVLPKDEQHTPNADGFTPHDTVRLAEGKAATFLQTESVLRLIQPQARLAHPPGIAPGAFRHCFTEHGFVAAEVGARTPQAAMRARAKFVLRNSLFWLHKGLSGLWYFAAYDRNPLGMGLLDAADPAAPTLPLQAWRDVVQLLSAGQALGLGQVRPLVLRAVQAPPPTRYIFPPADGHPGLRAEDVLVFLPFQLSPARWLAAVYVMTHDFPRDWPPQTFALELEGLAPGQPLRLRYRDPLERRDRGARILFHDPLRGRARVEVEVVDYPRLLVLGDGREDPTAAAGG